jgi:adenylate cyclase
MRLAALRARLRTRLVKALLVGNLVAALLLPSRELGWLQSFELAAYDRLVTSFAAAPQSERVVLVATTEEDINRFGYPIRDADLARVLERVFSGNPAAVAVDLYRDLPMPPGHEALVAVQRAHDNLYWVTKLPDAGNRGIPAPPALRGTGRVVLADSVTDAGGVVRRALLAAEDGAGNEIETMGVALAQHVARTRMGATETDPEDVVRFGRSRIRLLGSPWGPYAQVDAAGYQIPFDFLGGYHRFRLISFGELLDQPEQAATLAGKAVVVGTSALSVKDHFATPFSTGWGGVGPLVGMAVHAHVADQMLRLAAGETRNRGPGPRWAEHLMVWAAAMAGALLALRISQVLAVLAGLGCGLLVVGAGTAFAFSGGLLLPGVPVALAWLASAAGCNLAMHSAGLRERAQLRRSFEHYLDPRIIAEMMQGDELPSFGGEHREISVIFTDIAGFTTLAETMDAAKVAHLLGDYFEALTEAVVPHGGLVNDFIGDGMLVLFGAPMRQPDHADRAVAAALAMDAAAEAFSARLAAQGTPWGQTRIGVHTGVALVGNIGTRGRLKYGALGDTLNTASRVEDLNKHFGTRLCVSGETAERCTRHRFRPLAEVVVKGRQSAMPILVPQRDEPAPLLEGYAAAHAALASGAALAAFQALHQAFPDDLPTAFHAHRLAEGASGTVVVMREK